MSLKQYTAANFPFEFKIIMFNIIENFWRSVAKENLIDQMPFLMN